MRQLESFDTATACAPRSRVALLSAAIAFALASGLDPATAEAQSAGAAPRAAGLEEVIVTARKRDEDIQTVPQSIDVLGGGELASLGKVTFKDLQFEVPGFYIENYESRATIAMRGVGSQVPGRGEAIATHMNGIFQASTATSLSWLFDVERVEVLKGPQGTLYGRNSTGGAVNIISRRPGEEFDGGVKLEYGNDQTVRASVGVDVPLSADWSMRLAGTATRADGRLTNVATGDEIDGNEYTGGRITLVGDAGPVEVEFFGQISKETGGVGELIPLDADYEPRYDWDETYFDLPSKPEGQRDYKIAGLTLSGDLGGGYSWRSITGYQDYDEPESLLDVNPVPPPAPKVTIAFPQYAEQWSQELQLAFESERLNWVAGALYMDTDEGETRRVDILPFLPGALNSATDNTIKTYALFGDLNYNLTEELRLNVGLRYNRDDVQNTFVGSGPFDGQSFDLDSTQTEPTGRIGLDYTTSTGTMYYVSVAKGFKSGFNDVGFDLQGNPEPAEVEPEQLMAYEIGMKSSLPGDIGVFNVAAFYYDYQDMQVSVGGIPLLADGTPDPNGIPFYTTLNAGEAEILGLEATLSVVASDHLKFEANAGFLDTEFKEYESIDDFGAPADYSGNELPRAPEFSGNAAVTFDNLAIGGGTAAVRLEYQYRDEVFDNANNLYELQSTGFVNVLLTWDIGEWQVSASGRNLTEEEYFAFFDGRFFAPPGNFRSWLVGVSYNYH